MEFFSFGRHHDGRKRKETGPESDPLRQPADEEAPAATGLPGAGEVLGDNPPSDSSRVADSGQGSPSAVELLFEQLLADESQAIKFGDENIIPATVVEEWLTITVSEEQDTGEILPDETPPEAEDLDAMSDGVGEPDDYLGGEDLTASGGGLPPAPPLPPAEPTLSGPWAGGYYRSRDHLWDELARIDYLVRAQTVRWQSTLADYKPENLWGMVHVTEAEVQAYLDSDFMLPPDLPSSLGAVLQPYWQAAVDQARLIDYRIAQTLETVVLRLRRLAELYDLSALEKDILLVCLLPELDGRYRRLFGYLQDDAMRTRPSAELVLQILQPVEPRAEVARGALAGTSGLAAGRLVIVETEEQGDAPLSMRALRVDDRIVDYLLDGSHLDAHLSGVVNVDHTRLPWEDLICDEKQVEQLQKLAQWWVVSRTGATGATLFLHGAYGSGRLAAARALCTAAEMPLLVADAGAALQSAHGFERTVDLAYREARLRDAALYWSDCEKLLDPEQPAAHWDYLVTAAERIPCLTFLASRTLWDPIGRFQQRPFFRLAFPMPSYRLRLACWLAHLPPAEAIDLPEAAQSFSAMTDIDLAAVDDELLARQLYRERLAILLANSFQLTEGQIADAVAVARSTAIQRDPWDQRVQEADLYEGCRRQSSSRLATLAKHLEPRPGLSFRDLVLPRPNKRQLWELSYRMRSRSEILGGLGFERRLSLGKGLIALFTGSSGTGKTMAAQLLANEQGVDLYKIDMSAVVSKYVGETEKNLSRVFAEAEYSNAILFFDEADALFGKRSEVRDAHDRYANIEIAYLLQRMEEYSGVVILATNLSQNIDEAFLRRIHFRVDFPRPEAWARYRIWLSLFPPGIVYPSRSQIGVLAERFRLSGGNIQNAVIAASFTARAERSFDDEGRLKIKLRHLVLGIAREFQKEGQPLTKSLMGEEFYPWVERYILSPGKRAKAPANE